MEELSVEGKREKEGERRETVTDAAVDTEKESAEYCGPSDARR